MEPPYSLKWKPWTNDPRILGGVASQVSADWAFVQHMIASMDPKKGRAGIVLPHGVLFRGGQEAAIRQRVLDNDLLEAIIGLPANLFYNTDIQTAILVFRAPGTKPSEREKGVLFIDASTRFAKATNRNVLTEADVADIVTTYHSDFDVDGNPIDPDGEGGLSARFAPLTEIVEKGYDLNIGRYIRHAAAEQEDLGTLIEAYKAARSVRKQTEQRMFAVLSEAEIEGFNE